MRAIDCPCGHQLTADSDEDLVAAARDHITHHHPDMDRTDQQLRERVAADAYQVGADQT